MSVILGIIFRINNDLDTLKLIFKIEESFLLIPKDNNDFVNSGILKLLDLSLDQDLIFDNQQPLRLLQTERHKTC